VPDYTIDDFFTQREEITTAMAYAVSTSFKSVYFAEVTIFVLREVQMESQFENSILTSLQSEREALTANVTKDIQSISGQITTITSAAEIAIKNV